MSNYKSGADFERLCKAALESEGYACVRSAGSHSPADIIAMRAGETPVAVQCKRDGRLDPAEWNGFLEWCEQAGALPVMAEKVRGGIRWHEIKGRKTGRGSQPMEDWSLE